MSEEICPKCGKPQDDCICEVVSALSKDKTITVQHKGLEGLKGLNSEVGKKLKYTQEKLEEREAQLGILALKEFDKKKAEFLSKIPDKDKRETVGLKIGDKPEILDSYLKMTELLSLSLREGGVKIDDGTSKVPPDGSARAYNPETEYGSKVERGKALIDSLYNTLEDPNKTQIEKDKANKRLNVLIMEFMKGRKKQIREDPAHRYGFAFFKCPECGELSRCPRGRKEDPKSCTQCGAIFQKRA